MRKKSAQKDFNTACVTKKVVFKESTPCPRRSPGPPGLRRRPRAGTEPRSETKSEVKDGDGEPRTETKSEVKDGDGEPRTDTKSEVKDGDGEPRTETKSEVLYCICCIQTLVWLSIDPCSDR